MVKRLACCCWVLVIGLLTGEAVGQDYYEVSSYMGVVLTEVGHDGWLTWSNATTRGTCVVKHSTNLRGSTTWQPYVRHTITGSVSRLHCFDPSPPRDMALIPAGIFDMGDALDEGTPKELPVHTVSVSSFYMDKYEVTKKHWDKVAEWASLHGYDITTNSATAKEPDYPVHDASLYACVKWCNARSQMEGLRPCYTTGGRIYMTGERAPECNWFSDGYRLPTEAEWEKAARGGLADQRFPWGASINHDYANYRAYGSEYPYDTSSYTNDTRFPAYDTGGAPFTCPVGLFPPNGFGLYDMTGNVWERCWDRYSETYYASSPYDDPKGPDSGSLRVERGGFWGNLPDYSRVAYRTGIPNTGSFSGVGFRTVRKD